ncbi:MAG: hypothetical protein K0Q68_2794 [Moraxellaceae bacterium]|jgi:hypothetical protein|nr:hypothetical protein [Moraxellaceae bacterium]
MTRISKFTITGALCAGLLALGGCDLDDDSTTVGGGGGGGGTLTGTAAVGAVLDGATVEVRGSTSAPLVNTVTDASGRYTIDVSSLTPPMVIVVTGGDYDPDGAGPMGLTTNSTPLYSAAYSASGVANVTPLTTLALQNAVGAADLLTTFNNWGTTPVAQADLETAAARVRANLADDLTTAGVPATYDFFTSVFPTVGTGIDAVLDSIACTPTGGNGAGTYAVTCSRDGVPMAAFNLSISTDGFIVVSSGGGNMRVQLYINGSGTPNSDLTFTGIPLVTDQAGFCAAHAIQDDMPTGFVITNCTFSGNVGTISGTLNGSLSFSQTYTFS